MRTNTFRRYIHRQISQNTASSIAGFDDRSIGAAKDPWPRNVRNTPLSQPFMVMDMQYMAIEFMPTTTSGNDQAFQPCTSMIA